MGEGKESTMDSQLIPSRFYSCIRIVLILVLAGVQVCDSLDCAALLLQFPWAAFDQQAEYDVAWLERSSMRSLLLLCDMKIKYLLSDLLYEYDKILIFL